jgi:hypothetical protein
MDPIIAQLLQRGVGIVEPLNNKLYNVDSQDCLAAASRTTQTTPAHLVNW